MEISTPPKTTTADLLTTVSADIAQLQQLLAAEDWNWARPEPIPIAHRAGF
ncbi:hypothetical protein GCM10018954_008380 [Kutzneria kofuensis]